MKRRARIALFAAAAAIVAAAAAITAVALLRVDTSLEFTARDAVSGRWVWEAVMKLQGRTIVGYYQSDAALRPFRFTRLKPGAGTLEISAPGYQPVSMPVTLKRGANRLDKTIDMVGLGIPDLAKFYIFEGWDGTDMRAEIRPVSSKGTAVLNHPCMDLWIGCRVSVQVKNGAPVTEETEEGAARGEELFRGRVDWRWDPAPETQFRYSVLIPAAPVQSRPSQFRVIDYILVEPDPRAITREELDQLMSRVHGMDDPAAVAAALDAEKGRLRWFSDTSWNVKARPE
jgi:hypothetical protein